MLARTPDYNGYADSFLNVGDDAQLSYAAAVSSPTRGLRLYQIALIAFILACFLVKRMGPMETHHDISPIDWIFIVAAIWSAVSGFRMQRKISRRTSSRSTPLERWRAGHALRLCAAMSVGLWGTLVHYFGGPEWLANVLLGFGMLLLLVWRPGPTPIQAQPGPTFSR